MKEDYVTFEQAKLLKEKGFPQNMWFGICYNEFGKEIPSSFVNDDTKYFNCPSLSLVAKWLREAKNIYINIKYVNGYGVWDYSLYSNDAVEEWYNFKTYEEALSECIDKALKLI